ncbi:MAG TPA: hypothetical protein VNJ53_07045 [Gaiellaceae bacterium]|nr:hypothetical protein [Gaiellaceae bacterium]
MQVRPFLLLACGALALAAVTGASATATAGRASCGAGAGADANGYTYAGHQAAERGHGVRATITALRAPQVTAGHVAAWVGLGGPGQGPNGEDAWIQAGIASVPGVDPFMYAEVMRGGEPNLMIIEEGVAPGRSHSFAVLEMGSRPGFWRVWVDGQAVTEPIRLRGSSGRWSPIATTESWDGGEASCNSFGFRFERVSVSYGGGGSWRPFVSGHRFLDSGYRLRDLAAAPAEAGMYARTVSARSPLPYAFLASSS